MEFVKDYELKALFTHVIDVLDRLGIPYMVVGGFAAIVHGEPRLTIDVDIVADMKPGHVGQFAAAFRVPDFYVSEEGIHDSLVHGYPFNIIQPSTGAKIDIIPLPAEPFTRKAFERRRQMEYDETGRRASFISAEDVIVAKLIAFKKTGSDKHLRDARSVLLTMWERLDLDAVRLTARGAGVLEELEQLLRATRPEMDRGE